MPKDITQKQLSFFKRIRLKSAGREDSLIWSKSDKKTVYLKYLFKDYQQEVIDINRTFIQAAQHDMERISGLLTEIKTADAYIQSHSKFNGSERKVGEDDLEADIIFMRRQAEHERKLAPYLTTLAESLTALNSAVTQASSRFGVYETQLAAAKNLFEMAAAVYFRALQRKNGPAPSSPPDLSFLFEPDDILKEPDTISMFRKKLDEAIKVLDS